MKNEILEKYKKLGVPEKILNLVSKELKLPDGRLTALAKPRRIAALYEALEFKKGSSQQNRQVTELYSVGNYIVAVAKPGKEAAPDYTNCRNYITGESTNNPNDMLPFIMRKGNTEPIDKDMTFDNMFERIEHLMRANIFGLELLEMLLFRAAFMLDHKKNSQGNWQYCPSEKIVEELEKRIPDVSGIPIIVFLHFLEVLSLNEDVKMHTLGYTDLPQDYGRINTLLTFVHLIAVLLNRTSLAKFAGNFARIPTGIAPIAKTKIAEYFPLFTK